jgi:hypothetical protein
MIKKNLYWMALIAMVFFGACDDGKKTLSPKEKVLRELRGTWTLDEVSVNSQVLTNFEDFQLAISRSDDPQLVIYTCANRPDLSPWKAEGLIALGDDFETTLVRDEDTVDELTMSYVLSGDQLSFTFDYTGDGYDARTASTEGEWVFTFTRQ